MNYTVVWTPAAEDELAQMWTVAADRSALTAAANEIDRLLRSRPHDQGESRSGAVRVMFIHPLGVFFHIGDEDRIVSVLRVWRATRLFAPSFSSFPQSFGKREQRWQHAALLTRSFRPTREKRTS